MNRLVTDVGHEWLASRARRELDGAIRQQVGDVTGNAVQASVLEQLRIADIPLPREADPMVVTGTRCRIVAHVPFADVRGFVAGALQLARECAQPVARV